MGESKRRYAAANSVARQTIWDDSVPERLVVHTQMDVEPVLDSIHRDRELMPNNGHNKLVCRIPTIIYEQLQAQGIADDPDRFRIWLNSSDAAPWRIWKGQV